MKRRNDLKKGDLVKRKKYNGEEDYYVPNFISGVVVTDPHAKVFTKQTETGKALYSHERIVVDILAEGKLLKNVPTEYLTKH